MKILEISCPVCGRELVNLTPEEPEFLDEIGSFWCDKCNIDITITKSNED